MPISATLLTSGQSTSSAASKNTASVSPASNALILLAVAGADAAGVAVPNFAITGNGLTWQLVETDPLDNAEARLSLYRAMGTSPSSGAINIASQVASLVNVVWAVIQVTGVVTSGSNGSGAIVQSNHSYTPGGVTATASATLSAFANADNGAFSCQLFGDATAINVTPGSGFTELSETNMDLSGPFYLRLHTQWRATPDTSVDATASDAVDFFGMLAIEIAARVVSGTLAITESGSDTLAVSGGVGSNGVRLTLRDTDTGALVTDLTGMIVSIRENSDDEALLYSAAIGATDGDGIYELANTDLGDIGDYVYVTVEKSDHSVIGTYRVQVIDLNA